MANAIAYVYRPNVETDDTNITDGLGVNTMILSLLAVT